MKRIGVIVVHGVGEQRRFEFLESIASNLYRALQEGRNSRTFAQIQLKRGDQVPHLSEEESWSEAPAQLSWIDTNGEEVEVRFREVHWADLDMPYSWGHWIKLVAWSLGISGIKSYKRASKSGMHDPDTVGIKERLLLFGISLLFFLMLISVDLLYGLITRFGFRAQLLGQVRGLIYNYLGDVKLYQDWFVRTDDRLETLGEKSRVAIRRRMIRALAKTSCEVRRHELDEFYIWSHSLGTVVAFNGLMEPDIALPNYFTREEWESDLCLPLKCQADHDAPERQMPKRPSWLGKRDAISREKLFDGFKGLLTMGSPLDKFAALWPAIVPTNNVPIPHSRPWINVADCQDIVAGTVDDFPGCESGVCEVGGLRLVNEEWSGEISLFTAHTSYWTMKRGKNRLIDRLIPWIEQGTFETFKNSPDNLFSPFAAKLLFGTSLALLGAILLWLSSSLAWLLTKSGKLLEATAQWAISAQGDWIEPVKAILFDGSYFYEVSCWAAYIFCIDVAVVFSFALVRHIWEQWKFN